MNGKRGNQGTTEDEAYTEARNQATEVEFRRAAGTKCRSNPLKEA